MRTMRPCLWFDNQAEEAANFYVSVFRDARIVSVSRYGEAGAEASGKPKGSVMVVVFRIEGQEFMALNGGPVFTFSPAISFEISCETQDQIDELWDKLSQGGEILQCGWLTDKYGVSWQIVPTVLEQMLEDPDVAKSESVMRAMLQMKKIDIEGLKRAYEQA